MQISMASSPRPQKGRIVSLHISRLLGILFILVGEILEGALPKMEGTICVMETEDKTNTCNGRLT